MYEVLQYHKSPRYKDLLPVLGSQSMVMSEGHTWKAQRDAFNPGFSSSFLKTALPGFIGCTEHLVERLEAAAESREVVQLHHLTVLTTLEVICKASATRLSTSQWIILHAFLSHVSCCRVAGWCWDGWIGAPQTSQHIYAVYSVIYVLRLRMLPSDMRCCVSLCIAALLAGGLWHMVCPVMLARTHALLCMLAC